MTPGAQITLNFTLEHERVEQTSSHRCDQDGCDQPVTHKFTSPQLGSFPELTLWGCGDHVRPEWEASE